MAICNFSEIFLPQQLISSLEPDFDNNIVQTFQLYSDDSWQTSTGMKFLKIGFWKLGMTRPPTWRPLNSNPQETLNAQAQRKQIRALEEPYPNQLVDL